jgi:hypothetical protein
VEHGVAISGATKHNQENHAMLYLSIDQHAKQLTISLRDEDGNVLDRRQVSTEPKRVRAFFDDLRDRSRPAGGSWRSSRSVDSTTGCSSCWRTTDVATSC